MISLSYFQKLITGRLWYSKYICLIIHSDVPLYWYTSVLVFLLLLNMYRDTGSKMQVFFTYFKNSENIKIVSSTELKITITRNFWWFPSLINYLGIMEHTCEVVSFYWLFIFSRGKFASYSGHPGFDPALCFGDITLSLSHHPHNLGDRERKQMTRKLPVPVPVTIKKEERAPATMAEVALEGATKK